MELKRIENDIKEANSTKNIDETKQNALAHREHKGKLEKNNSISDNNIEKFDSGDKKQSNVLGKLKNSHKEHATKLDAKNKIESTGVEKGLSYKENEAVKKITERHFDRAREITQMATKETKNGIEKDDMGKNFTDHNEKHVKQVKEKTTEVLDSSVQAIKSGKMEREGANGDVSFSANVDYKVAQAAALAHDTGMSDDGYSLKCEGKNPMKNEQGNFIVEKQNPQNFESVRNNHTANSALNVLVNREQYKEAGFTDRQIDEIAILIYSHSKSNSGIGNLNDSNSWKEGFDRMDAFVEQYNKDHPDTKISFDRNQFEDNPDRLGSLATESFALRVGDVSRDSGPDAPSQSGDAVHVDKNDVDVSDAKDFNSETTGFDVCVGEEMLQIKESMSDKDINNIFKSKQVHIGEQNIVENHTEFKDGKLTHIITIEDGNHAPWCTAEAIKDHLGELASAQNCDFVVKIEFNTPCDEKAQRKYEEWKNLIIDDSNKVTGELTYSNVKIELPWEQKGENK